MLTKKNVVAFGGGTGLSNLLRGLLGHHISIHISAVVSMMDSGGSNRVLRDDFGMLPVSDVVQCIAALSAQDKTDHILRQLLAYRFHESTYSGMRFSNLMFVALQEILQNQNPHISSKEAAKRAIQWMHDLFNVLGSVIPVTYDDVELYARFANGAIVVGEDAIDVPYEPWQGNFPIVELGVNGYAQANPDALEAINKADLLILGPGDLYTSIICNLVVPKISEAIKKSDAPVLYIGNLMTKMGQTNLIPTLSAHVREVEKHVGRVDYILVNNRKINSVVELNDALKKYAEEFAQPVIDDMQEDNRVIRADMLFHQPFDQTVMGDALRRSLIRHNRDALARAVMQILF